jgi:hypothetical protein
MPPQEKTGIESSVRPKRRYFMAAKDIGNVFGRKAAKKTPF